MSKFKVGDFVKLNIEVYGEKLQKLYGIGTIQTAKKDFYNVFFQNYCNENNGANLFMSGVYLEHDKQPEPKFIKDKKYESLFE